MNCESLPLLLNAALDDKLSLQEQADMQSHLAECDACREQWAELQSLHRDLSRVLSPPSIEPVVDRVMSSLARQPSVVILPPVNSDQRLRTSSRNSRFVLFVVAGTLLFAVGTIMQWPMATPAVAEIAMATGPIDFKPANSPDWIATDGTSRVPLSAHTRVRTSSTSLCEIRTKANAVVRLNHETELVMHRAESVELVAGELWCRAPVSTNLQIRAASRVNDVANKNVFTCPSTTEVQWTALPNQEVSCLDVAATPVEITLPLTTCSIQPGECVTFASGSPRPEQTRHSNPMLATNWQLPLLVLGNPHDSELQDRLTGILATIGQSKVSYLYEDQIRQLGPPGAIPLLAFVRSPDSLKKPDLRIRAMGLAAELASESSLADLEQLLRDQDPVIQKMAARTIRRLQPDRVFGP